jgi:saccharopine dehydrogenase (NADP+, L-glutamate forming)
MHKTIVLIGAGKSATVLIDFLIAGSQEQKWKTIITDASLQLILSKTAKSAFAEAIALDITDSDKRKSLLSRADVVISMMPPSLHFLIAADCLELGKHLLTASYADDQVKKLNHAVQQKGLLFLCEMGLDPGIDHMSAMQLLDKIREQGGKVTSFKSHCGGLVAPESDDNPWRYKISWNPRNVALAGKAGAQYKINNQTVAIPYQQLFGNCETVQLDGLDNMAYYPNRDSLSYIPIYQLHDAHSFVRTTLRYPAFCKAWHAIVLANLADEKDSQFTATTTIKQWATPIAPFANEQNLALLQYLGLFEDEKLPTHAKCNADVLQYLLEKKLSMQPTDKDMIAMQHEVEYVDATGQSKYSSSSLVLKGENSLRTAMAKTVGLPLGIAAELLITNRLPITGVHIPIEKLIYEPVLAALCEHGIIFTEK